MSPRRRRRITVAAHGYILDRLSARRRLRLEGLGSPTAGGAIDVGHHFGFGPGDPPGLSYGEEPIGLYIAADHPLATTGVADPAVLAELPITDPISAGKPPFS